MIVPSSFIDAEGSLLVGGTLYRGVFVIGSDSSINHPISLKFELGEDTGLNVMEVATRRTSVGC